MMTNTDRPAMICPNPRCNGYCAQCPKQPLPPSKAATAPAMTRDEVLREFGIHPDSFAASQYAPFANAIATLRERLAAVERERDAYFDDWKVAVGLLDAAREVAHTMEQERDTFASMLHDCENERDGWRHRAERMAAIVQAVAPFAEVDVVNGGEYYDDLSVQPVLAAYYRYALDAAGEA